MGDPAKQGVERLHPSKDPHFGVYFGWGDRLSFQHMLGSIMQRVVFFFLKKALLALNTLGKKIK